MSNKHIYDVIILEDDPDLATMIEVMLVHLGLNVKKFQKPDQFMSFIENHDASLIIMDMLLSGADGRDICKALKANPFKNHINIMMCSAHPDAKTSCIEAGTNTFIEKPFEIDFFTEQVNKLLTNNYSTTEHK